MTINLDDVSYMAHLSLLGNSFTTPLINYELACITVTHDLGVTDVQVRGEFKFNKGVDFFHSWL